MKLFRNISLILLFLLVPSLSHAFDDGLPQDRAVAIDALFAMFDREDAPGASVMVMQDGKVLFKKAYGSANLEEKIPSATTTNYRIASVSKQFTAMAIMILAERKNLSYDDSLTRFFPDFPAYGKQITVRHLLNHTSGLVDYAEVIPAGTTTPLTDRDVLDLMRRQDKTMFPMKLLSHGGGTIGFTTQVQRFPDKRLTVIIIANRNNAPLSGLIEKIVEMQLSKS